MRAKIKRALATALRRVGISITSNAHMDELLAKSRGGHDINLISTMTDSNKIQAILNLDKSKAQLRQDLFALSELNFKRDGYFVEFGATDGIGLSNTYLMESEFGWTGILAEPARRWHSSLRANRNCHIDDQCVWRESNRSLEFNETDVGELSTIAKFSAGDKHAHSRHGGNQYNVQTITLLDLLLKYEAPSVIDYLSIDTEGSEFEILEKFDFDRYRFNVVTCEHNFTPMRSKIYELLSSKGYVRKFESISSFDDWYVFRS